MWVGINLQSEDTAKRPPPSLSGHGARYTHSRILRDRYYDDVGGVGGVRGRECVAHEEVPHIVEGRKGLEVHGEGIGRQGRKGGGGKGHEGGRKLLR